MSLGSALRKVGGWILILWVPIERLLQWAEHTEFIVKNIGHLSTMTFPFWFSWIVAPIAGLALIGWDIWDRRRSRQIRKPTPPTTLTQQPEFISMKEAATRLYESSAKIGQVRLSAAADKLGGKDIGVASPNERLDYLAHFIAGKITIHGCKPPSRIVKEIDEAEVRRASFFDGATILRDNSYRESIYWVDLCVKSAYMNQLIASLTETETPDDEMQKGYIYESYRMNPTKENAIKWLAYLRGDGVVIRNSVGQVTDQDLPIWTEKVQKWMRDAIDTIRHIDEADAEIFRTLDVVSPARVQFAISIQQPANIRILNKAYNEHDLRLARVYELLRKYTGLA